MFGFFCVVDTLLCGGVVRLFGISGMVGPVHPGPGAVRFAVEVLNVGGRLTHGDLVLDTEVDFLAVVEHRLIPAGVSGEWAGLRRKGLATVWAPASQDASHVGNVGVGVVSLRGAPLSLLTFAAAQFKRFF